MSVTAVIVRGSIPTNVSSNIAVETRKDHVTVLELFWCAFLHHQFSNALRERQRLLPLDRILVFLAG
jgi:hypothetical protein